MAMRVRSVLFREDSRQECGMAMSVRSLLYREDSR